ncbi:MAG TPA: VWA domain-containing protein, partial [Bacteroidales bacterium]|nr:VWA domain-containing protein [Bacteroidales bacterium]
IPVMLVFFLWFMHWKRSTLRKYGEFVVISRLIPDMSKAKHWFKFIVLILALVFMIVGIANPQIGSQLEKEERKGVDIIIALDVSNSMLAEDIRPNRIERARQAVNRFIDRLSDDRIGLIVFAGRAYPLLPLTNDYAAAKMFLTNATTDIVPVQGTSIADAIDLAIRSFPQGPQGKALVIITDGEDHEGNVIEKAEEAYKREITVHTIGIGSVQGVPIPLYRNNVRVGFRATRDGQTVMTRLNETMLQQIAAAGNGVYVRATNAQFGLTWIFDEINKMEKGEFEAKAFAEFESRFYYFLYLALILLIIELIVYERSSRWLRKFSRFIPVLLIFMSFDVQAQTENKIIRRGNKAFENERFQEAELHYRRALEENNNNFRGNFNLGNSIYRQDHYDEAARAFQRAIANQTDEKELSKAFYNFGNSLLMNQQIPESIEAYKNALRLNPSDDDARHNLVYAMNLLEQQEQQQQQDGERGDDDSNQDEDSTDQQQDQDEQQQEPKEQEQQETQQPQQISRQEAERMLQALKEEEQKTMEKIKEEKFQGERMKIERDW